MPHCEDYPCCGHGEAGDGGACPDENGKFPCIKCGKQPYDVEVTGSSYCSECLNDPMTFHDPECPGCDACNPCDDYDECEEDEEDNEDVKCFEFEHDIERLRKY